MEDLRRKLKQWTSSIQSGQLQNIASEITDSVVIESSSCVESNKALVKLLLHICHTIQKNKNALEAINVFEASEAICAKLTSISDCLKFYSATYHIASYLIDTRLYEKAMKICDYILPGSVFHNAAHNESRKICAKFSCLWYSTIEKLFPKSDGKLDSREFILINRLIKYELNLQTVSLEDDCKYLLSKIMAYLEKFTDLGNKEQIDTYTKMAIEHLEASQLSLGSVNKFSTYRSILFVVSQLLQQTINIENINFANATIKRIFKIFEKCVETDKECCYCFKLYVQFCRIFMQLFSNFSTSTLEEIKIYQINLEAVSNKYVYENALKWNAYSILKILEHILFYWEKFKDTNSISNDMILIKIIEILQYQSNMFSRIELSECYCKKSVCQVKFDVNNDALLKSKALCIVSRYYTGELTRNLATRVVKLAEQCLQNISYLHRVNCDRWMKIWHMAGSYIYNIGVRYEKTNYDKAIHLYSLLAEGTVQLNAFNETSSYIKTENPLSAALYRLSSTHFYHAKYPDAMITSALNAYIGLKDPKCKAFRMWTNIKYKYPMSHETTIVSCLKSKQKHIQQLGISVKLTDNDIETISIREIQAMKNAEVCLSTSISSVLDLLDSVDNSSRIIFAHAVQMLGFHMLFYDTNCDTSRYFTRALSSIEEMPQKSAQMQMLEGQLRFYCCITELRRIQSAIEIEMKTSVIIKLSATDDVNLNGDPVDRVVPAYQFINIDVAANIAERLAAVLDSWSCCCDDDYRSEDELWITQNETVQVMIAVAEYARFYRYRQLEIRAWKIAHSLAKKSDNRRAIVWIVGRSISSGYIEEKEKKESWIHDAEDMARYLTDSHEIETVAMLKLSLAEHYFKHGVTERAYTLFNEAMLLPKIEFTQNLATFLLSADIMLAYKINSDENSNLFDYIRTMVKGLYTMLTLDESSPTTWQPPEYRLYALDILFKFTNHVVLRMNSLFSFREITAHVTRRLTIVQKLGSSLHIAECLKNLCFIDISRGRLQDCEVKLQGIEHILKLDKSRIHSDKSRTQCHSPSNNFIDIPVLFSSQVGETIRDMMQNPASPVLRRREFAVPNFMKHSTDCRCFSCSNVDYQYVVFSCMHIRAQLYALQKHVNQALEYFQGAFSMVRKLVPVTEGQFPPYYHVVEYTLFIMDFARFLKYSMLLQADAAVNLALHTLEVCERYRLNNHPVYFSVKEFIFECRFQSVFTDEILASLTINSTREAEFPTKVLEKNQLYETPVRRIENTAVKPLRRRHSPPILQLSQATVDEIEVDDSLNLISLAAALEENMPSVSVNKTVKIRPICRKITLQELEPTTPESNLDSVTDQLKQLSVTKCPPRETRKTRRGAKTATLSSSTSDSHDNDDDDDDDDDDEVVECSIIEPRRSRRVAAMTLTNKKSAVTCKRL